MTNKTQKEQIEKFAAQVRAALKDLSKSEIAELTEGLEADLAATAEEQGASFKLGDAGSYADELRNAAGLPKKNRKINFSGIGDLWHETIAKVESNKIGAAILAFFKPLAPVWWFARAYMAWFILGSFGYQTQRVYPESTLEFFLLLLFIFVSVQLGRGAFKLNQFFSRVVVGLNIFAVVISPAVLATASNEISQMYWAYTFQQNGDGEYLPEGLTSNGAYVENIFVYDAEGNPLKDVQLFDQNGDPLLTQNAIESSDGVSMGLFENNFEYYYYIANPLGFGDGGWNVYPLKGALEGDIDAGKLDTPAVDAKLPFQKAPALQPAPEPSVSPSPEETSKEEGTDG